MMEQVGWWIKMAGKLKKSLCWVKLTGIKDLILVLDMTIMGGNTTDCEYWIPSFWKQSIEQAKYGLNLFLNG